MNLLAFAVFDEKAGAYEKPFFCPAVGIARRLFGDGVNMEDTALSKHPGDYKLYQIGHFELESGILIGMDTAPKFLCHGSDFAKQEINWSRRQHEQRGDTSSEIGSAIRT